ncbi:MAG: carboxypeptidase-like regulatory domain-containing protein, partial [Candidatus Obscuribacterales bacterium]|nr:carboxypeptidase-like regulatory domain-containing protein [Candidatus Obscuribacterales bacterium]
MVVTRELSFNLGGSVSSMGLPVQGSSIRLYDYWRKSGSLVKHFLCEQTTSNKGTFSFDVRKGIYCIELIPGEHTRFARQSIEAIKVTSNTNFDLILKAGVILSGTVRDAQGRTISDAELLVFGIEPHVIRVAQKLDENGNFSLSLPQGKYYLALRYSEATVKVKGKKGNTPFLCPFFQVLELKKDTKHDISLPTLISFKGKVSNAEGHPVSGAKAIVRGMDKLDNVFAKEISMSVTATTQKDGSFECLVQKGTYNIRLLPAEDSHLAEKTITSIFVDSDRKRNYSLEAGYSLSGRVLYKGNPVPNATVNLVGVNLDSVALSNEEGEYHFSWPGGSYDVITAAQPDSLGTVSPMELAPSKSALILDHDTVHDIE